MEEQRVARPRGGRPRPGEPGVAVVDEVDGQLTGDRVEGTDGVGPQGGPLLAGMGGAHGVHVERFGVHDARAREDDLDVAIRVLGVGEGGEVAATGDDANHVRGQPLGAPHPQSRHSSWHVVLLGTRSS